MAERHFGRPRPRRPLDPDELVPFVLGELTHSPELWVQRGYLARVISFDDREGPSDEGVPAADALRRRRGAGRDRGRGRAVPRQGDRADPLRAPRRQRARVPAAASHPLHAYEADEYRAEVERCCRRSSRRTLRAPRPAPTVSAVDRDGRSDVPPEGARLDPEFLSLPVGRGARGVDGREPRRAGARHRPPRRALRRARRLLLRAQGAARRHRVARIPPPEPPRRHERADGAADRRREGTSRRRRETAPGRAHHALPRVLAALPNRPRPRRPRRAGGAAPGRARRAARAPAPRRLLLGRLLALERALPSRRGRARGLRGGRRDGRAAGAALGRPAALRPGHRLREPQLRVLRRRLRVRVGRRPRPGRARGRRD